MAGFFMTLGVAAGIVLALCLLFASVAAGFKAMFLGIAARLREALSGATPAHTGRAGGFSFGARQEPLMKEIVITTGKCQCCGRTYIGTSQDSDCPLKAVEFMGAGKVLCQDCLERIMADFQRSAVSGEKRYSASARELRDLLSSLGGNC
ncbi:MULTISPECIES: hypothetical protein [unclassified Desulfovibrio]|uniref:hypothetical protein n=1 Tax=unclassified Desulfovibrio TaxID=2593640 RepID=UPI0013EB2101|nr:MULTISPECIES: hypothetical protein [unclassified Desulfovibrio]